MPFTCLQCGEQFSMLSLLEKHRLETEHWRDLTCQICKKVFARKDILQRHKVIHSNTSIECGVCGRPFSRRDSMLRHMRMSHACDNPEAKITGFKLQKIQRRRFDNFHTTTTSYKLSFDETVFSNVSDVHLYSVSLLDEVIRGVASEWKMEDYVQLSFSSESVDNTMSTPFLPVKQVSAERILSTAESLYQAKENLFLHQSTNLEVKQVDMPTGVGRKFRFANIDRFLREKRCVIRIENQDDLCCARAIVTAKARIDEHEQWNSIRQGCKIQEDLAKALHQKAGVPMGLCGIKEIKNFQSVLTNYQIHVISMEQMNNLIYKGPKAEKKIYLFLHNNHYDVITSMPAFLSRSYFCDVCHKGYNNKHAHKCVNACTACLKLHDRKDETSIYCCDCNRVFKGKDCFDLHKKKTKMGNSTCSTCYICRKCDQIVKPKHRNSAHRCGEKFCKVCKEFFPIDHKCYMLPFQDPPNQGKSQPKVFIFFDFECRQDDMIQCEKGYIPNESGKCQNCQSSSCGALEHVPNLCVVHKVCTLCMNQAIDENSECHECGLNEYIFSGTDTVSDFCRWLFSGKNCGATVLAHNFRGYDSYPILRYLFDNGIAPKVIPNGTKTMSINLKNLDIRLIDSLNFLPMALSKLPETFGFQELTKGYFPHLFNRKENQYVVLNHLPDEKYYSPDSMMPSDREKFFQWYNKHRHDRFDFQRELLRYCRSDVDILRKCVMRFRNDFLEITGVDPISSCFTIASACNLVFRRNFLKPETIAVIPSKGYHLDQIQSTKALQWLHYFAHTTGYNIQHAKNGKERIIGPYRVDGYYETENGEKIVLEFHGDAWHGNPEKFSKDTLNPVCQMTMGELYNRTLEKQRYLESLGYIYRFIWESEFDRQLKEVREMASFVEQLDLTTPLQPRDAFYGGRTEAFTLLKEADDEETIDYYDVTSLYPFINKAGKVPLGHPTIVTRGFKDLSQYEGLVKCKVLPPRKLYIPVLPHKVNDKLLFALCKACAETQQQSQCCHSDELRAFVGTWVTDELKKAVEKGYRVLKMYEVWHFETVSQYDKTSGQGGVFVDYVNTFLKLKQESSGWPSWCATEEEKLRYISSYEKNEGIRLDYHNVKKNPGLRALAKLCLNSFWGKFAQRDNLVQVEYLKDPAVLFEKLTSNICQVTDLHLVSDSLLTMNWRNEEEFALPLKNANVVIAAYTTAQARLQLYSYLESLNKRVLYVDTDSVVFYSKEGDKKPPLGDFLGDLTDEVPNNSIQSFVTGGPKNYAYVLKKPKSDGTKTCCKIRGITLNYQTTLDIDYDTIDRMVRSDINDNATMTKVSTICRDKQNTRLLTKVVSKDYRIVFDKRVRIDNYGSVPYGF